VDFYRGNILDEDRVPEEDDSEETGDLDAIAKDKPIDLIPKSVLEYRILKVPP
jgi:hypothetical protein